MSAGLFQLIGQLLQSLCCTLTTPEPISPRIHGSMLQYRLDKDPESKIHSILRAAELSKDVIVAFVEDQTLFLKLGFDSYNAVRLDGGSQSPLWSMANAAPVSSPSQPQWVSLTYGSQENISRPIELNASGGAMQLLAYFLQVSLRLCPLDVSAAITAYNSLNWQWLHAGKIHY